MLSSLIKAAFKRETPIAELESAAVAHYQRGEFDKAEESFRRITLRCSSEVKAWSNLAVSLLRQQKYAAALPVLLQVVELQPDLAEAHFDIGVCYNRLKKNEQAVRHYEQAIALKPDLHKAHANIVNAYLDSCDWPAVDRWCAAFLVYKRTHAVELWAHRLQPFCALTLFPGDTAKELAIHRAQLLSHSIRRLPETSRDRSRKRIRIGYVSADFYSHATAHLTFGLYAAHNRERFEVFAYSTGPNDESIYRKHIIETCDHFVDVRYETAERTARRIREDEIDILVDMKGYTADGRPEIFAYRSAPIQVSYLGYPGTSGADFIDYFISDRIATPPGYEAEFTEKLVYLPGSYQVNDDRQPISAEPVGRADIGLPQHAFVYSSFNRPRKIDRAIFDRWMTILRRVPDSVLWLIGEDACAESNLRKEAAARQVAPERLVFSPQADKPAHLARHALADLFLDTYNYNAHTGASDALWAGLPVLTCPGHTFATRVAASLLHAAGLAELVAPSLSAYEAAAIRFGENPESLKALKLKLERQRLACALFDTPRYVRNLEAAYKKMHEIFKHGGNPESFAVAESRVD